jgi:hypothetical protein
VSLVGETADLLRQQPGEQLFMRGPPLQSECNVRELHAAWSRLYGDYFIMAFPSFDIATDRWAPQADVSWNHNSPYRKFAFIRFSNRLRTEAEAVAFTLDMTPVWIERHGQRLHSAGAELMRVIDVMGALKERMARTASKKRPRRALLAGRERVRSRSSTSNTSSPRRA